MTNAQATRIGIYIRATHLGAWEAREGFNLHLPLSGTDRATLWLAGALHAEGRAVMIFTDNLPARSCGLLFHAVANLPDAMQQARNANCSLLITSNLGDNQTLSGIAEAKRCGMRLVLWDHNGPTLSVAELGSSVDQVARIVCVSHMQADECRHRQVFDKFSVIYNPLDLEFWSPGGEIRQPFSVVYLGSLTPSKGFHHLAHAWPDVRSHFPAAILHVCGSGKLYDRSAQLGPLGIAEEGYERSEIMPCLGASREEALAKGVIFHGLTAPEQTRSILRRALVGVVNPNSSGSAETFCVSAVEMQACGLPVIGGRAGGLLETVADGKSGLLVANPENLADAVGRLLKDNSLRLRFSKNAVQQAGRFAPQAILLKWNQLLDGILTGAKIASPVFQMRPLRLRRYIKEAIRLTGAQRSVARILKAR